MREIHALERRNRDVVRAAQVVPNLAVAVQEAIYNAVDARARSIKVLVDVPSGSFSVADDVIAERVRTATSRLTPSHSDDNDERKKPAHYGKRGEFLHALATLATVEVESRVQDQWTAHRKLIQEGAVVFNARSKVFRKGHGTTLTARRLFNCLPVRAKDLRDNPRHCTKLAREIQTFCVNLSMIWPTLSLELVFENNPRQSLRISGVDSCRERFVKMFGNAIGNELEYVDFSPADSQFAVRGYFALIQDSWEVSPAGLKQARAYYQYVFFQNQWIESFHHECAKRITQLALELNIGIPIFVLKVDCPSAEFALLWAENGKCVELKSPPSLDRLLSNLLQTLKGSVDSANTILDMRAQDSPPERTKDEPLDANGDLDEELWRESEICQLPDDDFEESVPFSDEEPEAGFRVGHLPVSSLPLRHARHAESRPHEDDLVLYEMRYQDDEDGNGFHQECSDKSFWYSEYEEEEGDEHSSTPPQQANEPETIFHVQDAKTNWGEPSPAIFTDRETVDPRFLIGDGADLCPSCASCGRVNMLRDSAHEYPDDESREFDDEFEEAEPGCEISSPPASHPQELQNAIDIDDSSSDMYQEARCSSGGFLQLKAPDVDEGELANVFFTDSKLPKLAGDTNTQALKSQETNKHGLETQDWITSRSLKTELDGALESSPLRLHTDATPQSATLEYRAKKRPRQHCSKYFPPSEAGASPVAPSEARQPRKPRTSSLTLPRTSKCTLRVDNVGELKQLRNFKISKSLLDTLEVIRQVDRKFILVRVTDHSSFESLLLCIDQHAADERVKLEQLELELFGPHGDELRINVSEFAQPQLILLNAKEAQTLAANEDIVRVWGFDFEFLESETESSRFTRNLYTSMEYRGADEEDGEYYVELRATPKVDTRSANADDFREFIQVLSQNEGFWSWSVMRPPVITRLLHSRACRSAIMFGDYLSVSQCRELVDGLRKCKLPFQCAHGRPSVVPLVEFINRE